jgi:hypothetical protein
MELWKFLNLDVLFNQNWYRGITARAKGNLSESAAMAEFSLNKYPDLRYIKTPTTKRNIEKPVV